MPFFLYMDKFKDINYFAQYIQRSYTYAMRVIDSCKTEEHVETTIELCNNLIFMTNNICCLFKKHYSRRDIRRIQELVNIAFTSLDQTITEVKEELVGKTSSSNTLGFH